MRGKFFKLLLISLLCAAPACAKTIQAAALEDFSTAKPSKEMKITTLTDLYVDGANLVPQGAEVVGEITDVTSPKRLKRDASFAFVPRYYTDAQGHTVMIKGQYTGRYTTALNKGQLTKTAALTAGNYVFVKGFSTGVTLLEGAVKNQEGNRLKSGVTAAYKSSPLSYIEEGKDIEIKKGEVFLLNFKTVEDEQENKPNYEYQEGS
jgi:hypothetical protein